MAYDDWRLLAPEDDASPPEPCCVCTGEGEAPCGEECEATMLAAEARRERRMRVDGLRRRIYLANMLVSRYRDEEPEGGTRERMALEQISTWMTELGCLEEP